MARVAAVADAKAVGPGRASARAARCVATTERGDRDAPPPPPPSTSARKATPDGKENARTPPPKLRLYESGAALHAVLDRLAGMEKHLKAGLDAAAPPPPRGVDAKDGTSLDYVLETPATKTKPRPASTTPTALRANRASPGAP